MQKWDLNFNLKYWCASLDFLMSTFYWRFWNHHFYFYWIVWPYFVFWSENSTTPWGQRFAPSLSTPLQAPDRTSAAVKRARFSFFWRTKGGREKLLMNYWKTTQMTNVLWWHNCQYKHRKIGVSLTRLLP